MIDWDAPDPKPDFVAPQNLTEIRTLSDALKLLDEWIAAYDELKREHARTQLALIKAHFLVEYYQTLAKNEEALRGVAQDATTV